MVRERSSVQIRQVAQYAHLLYIVFVRTAMATTNDTRYLTKTDFICYLQCPKSFWLLKHKPEVYPYREFSDFLKKIVREGYEVEGYAQQLFDGGVVLPFGSSAPEKTREALSSDTSVFFQATFHTDDHMFARVDMLERNDDGTYTLYEVKSSTSIKKDAKHNHIKDACFQMIALERSGLVVRDVFIIHVNGEYVRGEVLEPHVLLRRVCVTDAVRKVEEETRVEVDQALTLLAEDSIDENGCGCYRKTRSNHCDSFLYFNRVTDAHSVWELCGIRERKLLALQDCGAERLRDVPDAADLNIRQRLQVRSAIEGRPIIQGEAITKMLRQLIFPLYFFDYETAMYAVPRMVGTKPWQQIPFQYSLHVLHEDGRLTHKECLSDSLDAVDRVLESLCADVGEVGSVVSWHASFEQSRNREMGVMYPAYCDALVGINERMFDLEDIFKEAYVDAAFCGSTSIKKVLPVLCPDLSYADLQVQDGTQAMEQWLTMVDGDVGVDTTLAIREALLAYCALDTYAMVELYRKLCDVVR